MTEVLPLLMGEREHMKINRHPGMAHALKTTFFLSQENTQLNREVLFNFSDPLQLR